MRNDEPIIIPEKATAVRIHGSGDFFSQDYFDKWLQVCRDNPDVEFWAFTKSLKYWVNRIDSIPDNLVLTASYGGLEDYLIFGRRLKCCRVYKSEHDVPEYMNIDTDDKWARVKHVSFALLDNNNPKNRKEKG